MPVFRLSKEELIFPAPALAEDNGLLAVGGDLCVDRLLLAYSHGIFPWYNPGEEILWWCPRERFLIFPGKIHVSHSMKKYMGVEGTWISDDMEAAYLKLHKAGFAVSVEVYEDGILSGGLYGVAIGRCFFGESMFSEKANGSKAALIIFSRFLEQRSFLFIDCQFHTDHLEHMGGEYVPWERFEDLLQEGTGYWLPANQ